MEVHPNEGMTSKPPPFRLITATGLRPPRGAVDDTGHDVQDLIARLDDRSPSNFALARLRGYAADHSLTLDLGGAAADRLFLTAWTDYAFSSDNVAAGQAGMAMHPPSLQMRDGKGEWQTVITEVGIPVGRPQTIALDLAGRWLSNDRHVRIVTNMRIYWDHVQVGEAAPDVGIVTRWLDPVVADLRDRGFSVEQAKAAPQRSTFDYARVSAQSPWKVFPGRYTRLGDVRELLQASDDVFVFSKPGDELAVSFDATALPPLGAGLRRTFLVFSDGYSKEMDINSATPDSGAPLPFHAMSRYPYGSSERFPMTPEKERLMDKYNTRVVRREIPFLIAAKARTPTGFSAAEAFPRPRAEDSLEPRDCDQRRSEDRNNDSIRGGRVPNGSAEPSRPQPDGSEHRSHPGDDRFHACGSGTVPPGPPRRFPGVRSRSTGVPDDRGA